MKTSASQFFVLIDYMERNGDLNKPAGGPYGRLEQHRKWAELEKLLNMDVSGEIKSIEKWKKVWSDLKNNTKRKAAKIHQAAVGTGGGPACTLVLSDLELRVLNIIGSQAATGLTEVEEVGAPSPRPVQALSPTPFSTAPILNIETLPMLHVRTEQDVLEEGAPSTRAGQGVSTPSSPIHEHMGRRHSASRRRTPRLSRVDAATRHFLASDLHWRNMFQELATEHLRLRRREDERQAHFQALLKLGLDILKDYVNK